MPVALQASNLTKALGYSRKYFQKAMTVKGTFEDFAEAVAVVGPWNALMQSRVTCCSALFGKTPSPLQSGKPCAHAWI